MNYVLTEKVKELSILLNDKQIQQFEQYYNILVEWNKVMNLTAITEYEEVVEKHFLDSLTIVNAIHVEKIETLIDVGTGAGFPGIPLKIAFPHLKVTLLDSLNKRIKFLNEVIDLLELNDIKAIHGRAEDYAKQAEYREQYDICVSRAVANLSTLSEYCLPFVKMGGCFVSYKSGECESEVADAKSAIYLLGGKLNKIEQFGYSDNHRSFVIIDKVMNTSNKYPRKAGLPSKKPL